MQQSNKWTRLTRRTMLKGALEAGGVLAATSLIAPHYSNNALSMPQQEVGGVTPAPTSDAEISWALDLAATLEALTMTFYETVLSKATFVMEAEDADHLRGMQAAEKQHLDAWQGQGGIPAVDLFQLPERLMTDAHTFVETGLMLEATSVGLYLAATRQFAIWGQPTLAALSAQHAASDAQHHTLLSRLAGLKMDTAALAPLSPRVDVVPVLKAFLEDGSNPLRWQNQFELD